ncbi:MAG: hypothetical protein ABSF65_12370 [Candidatus Bathyarchaeia archaeon]
MPWETEANSTGGGVPANDQINGGAMTSPPANYSDVYSNGLIYRYVWQIDIQKTGTVDIPPYDLILVDASTGQTLPNLPVF